MAFPFLAQTNPSVGEDLFPSGYPTDCVFCPHLQGQLFPSSMSQFTLDNHTKLFTLLIFKSLLAEGYKFSADKQTVLVLAELQKCLLKWLSEDLLSL